MKYLVIPACLALAACGGPASTSGGGSFNFDRQNGQIIVTGNAAQDLSEAMIRQSVVNPVCAPNDLEISEFTMEPRSNGTNAVRAVCS